MPVKSGSHFILTVLTLILFTTLFITYACAPNGNEQIVRYKTYSLSQLQEDFGQLKEIIDKEHPKLYTDKEKLAELFKSQYLLLKEGMEEQEFYKILAPIVAALNCGHTWLYSSDGFYQALVSKGRYLPLMLKIINSRAYVYKCLGEPAVPLGAEIISINGQSIQSIIPVFLANISADGANNTLKYFTINHLFNGLYFNALYVLYIENPKEYIIAYKMVDADNKAERILTPVSGEKLKDIIPIKFQVGDDGYYSFRFEKNYAVLDINSFDFHDYDRQKKFWDFLETFFADVRKNNIRYLILDLRGNGGGDPDNSAYVFRFLITEAQTYFSKDMDFHQEYLRRPLESFKNNFDGKLYILINGGSFSSTGHLCSLLKYHKIGIFIGEETGGSFASGGICNDVILYNTQIKFRYSTRIFKTAVSGLTPARGIMPDYEIIPTREDYLSGKDPEMEFAVELINKSTPD